MAYFNTAHELMHQSRGILPLCVNAATKEPDGLSIVCTNLSGDVVAQLEDASVDDPYEKLRRWVDESVPLSPEASRWRIILQDGSSPSDEDQRAVPLKVIFAETLGT